MARTVDFRIIPIKASFDRAVPKPAPAIQVPNLQVAAAEGRESLFEGPLARAGYPSRSAQNKSRNMSCVP